MGGGKINLILVLNLQVYMEELICVWGLELGKRYWGGEGVRERSVY
jgi:hypothetical protein